MLGASGAVIGTRFQATAEALADPAAKQAIIGTRGGDTERNGILDLAQGSSWPRQYTTRTLAHPVLDQWRGREDELADDPGTPQAYRDGVARGDWPPLPVWAGEAVDLITGLPPAGDVVTALDDLCEGMSCGHKTRAPMIIV